MEKIILIEKTKGKNPGTILKNCFPLITGALDEENSFIPKSHFVYLNEKLDSNDERKIREIIKDMLRKVFWRLYTRNSFVLD